MALQRVGHDRARTERVSLAACEHLKLNRLKIQSLSHTSYVSSAQQPAVMRDYTYWTTHYNVSIAAESPVGWSVTIVSYEALNYLKVVFFF